MNFYRGADCCVLVYDVTQERSYDRLEKWRNAFNDASNADQVPFIIIGNKSDMGSRVNPYRVKEEWIDSGKASCHFQASAITNQSVEEAFAKIAELAHQHL